MVELWVWALILLAVGLALSLMEVFVPSGGLIGFLAAASIIASIVMAFRQGSMVGLAVLAGALVTVPFVVFIGLQIWPRTALGRRMLLEPPDADDLLPDHPKHRQLKSLVGRIGQTKSTMLPSGGVIIDGRTIDAMSEGVPIEAGQTVRVIEVRGTRVVVRPVDATAPDADSSDPLQRPIDTVANDPFQDPQA
jgi:membrane-bound ClpP family serine protease